MKKIFTLLVTVTMFASAFAQNDRGGIRDQGYDKRDVAYNDMKNKNDFNRYDNDRYSYSKMELQHQVEWINRDYDHRIMEVKSRFFLSRFKKEQMICVLEQQRKDDLRQAYAKFNDRRNRYGDDDHGRRW